MLRQALPQIRAAGVTEIRLFTIGIPIAFGGVYFGIRDVTSLVLLVQIEQVIRFFLTLKRYNSYKWANNLTELVK